MTKTLTEKILSNHLITGEMIQGQEIGIKIDQTLTQDATGTMAYLQFEAIGVPKVKTELSVSYIDHNTLQTGFENADDHLFLQSIAAKYGLYFSRPGNGICHQVHLERFGIPGKTLLGSDSHTPTGGGIGMLAMGAGGLDVAVAMAGGPFYLTVPKVINVELKGKLKPYVSAKDIILKVLEILSVKGGVGKVIEYTGEGLKTLSVPERSTITNMGAELGATTSIFPSDETTKAFLEAQDRGSDYKELKADEGAVYDERIIIDLDALEPLTAAPHSPDNIQTVRELNHLKVNQVAIGSCTNSSFTDLTKVAHILEGKTVNPSVSLVISPGSKQVFEMLAENGALKKLIASGARILESACGPCIGMGQSPSSGAISLRTFNRNFYGRSGTKDASIYLVSPETAAASALTGYMTDPTTITDGYAVETPTHFLIDDNMILKPSDSPETAEIIKGPNIKPLPVNQPLENNLVGNLLLKVEDNITTDHIMPAGAKVLPLRSNIPEISKYAFSQIDPSFSERAIAENGGFIVGGHNYGQGSSREHAALAPMYLGIKGVITQSFARIYKANLVNFGLLPLTFKNEEDYNKIQQGDNLEIENVKDLLIKKGELILFNATKDESYPLVYDLSNRAIEIILAGGLLNYTKQNNN
ncbi:aconitate hydratase [endosymbiont 'TC1' of Trimyema compressum]|uniref:aconitate hydratase n=1 Tax=endosymbiont 'TC1' of Trimyema compressum TaxID=243899 RepID=UPI0007F10176|nr:aconitate hydratase [endosymbiont 'TC1' of Trimyema compressum]AMP20897.1 aconitate hydratase [endosymbiont 'TC1' of Trimyema compressum]